MTTIPRLSALCVALALAACSPAASQQPQTQETVITGIANVSDGDTLTLTRLPVRLWGVDAPEGSQTCGGVNAGDRAREAMRALAQGREVVCTMRDYDRRNRRPVAICTVEGRDLSALIAEQGWAWDYREYSGGAYAAHEQRARSAGRGVHALACTEMPWEWRARLRAERAARRATP